MPSLEFRPSLSPSTQFGYDYLLEKKLQNGKKQAKIVINQAPLK